MDKLEKALEKARLLRQAHLSSGLMKSTAEASPSKLKDIPIGTVSISAEVLEANRIVAHRTRSTEADLFRILRAQILQTMSKHGFRTLAITSPNYGEGKTTTAINLVLSIALDLKQTVLLVDLDLRKPSVHEYLGLSPSYGLTDYLSGSAALPDCLMRLPFDRLSMLPVGACLDHSSELLGSPQMGALAHELKTRYPDRLVIYDMPPLLAQDDPLTFVPHVEAVLLVVQDGVTKVSDVKRSLEILDSANVIGTVLNNSYKLPSFAKT
ncbi:MAG: CpsD/CapB family tyrosine-protein kinase [Alphaproteobacteria bacterium]|nr:CpsD/CapB family tyrosine-protein kinase [Alphaproteobacteria bacterium]